MEGFTEMIKLAIIIWVLLVTAIVVLININKPKH